jgi:hypothetical protein
MTVYASRSGQNPTDHFGFQVVGDLIDFCDAIGEKGGTSMEQSWQASVTKPNQSQGRPGASAR